MPTVIDLFHQQVKEAGDTIAVFAPDGTMTYQKLSETALRISRLLLRHRVQQEEVVAILAEPSLSMISGIWGILMAGACYLPLDPGYPPARLISILKDSGVRFIITTTRLSKYLDGIPVQHILTDQPDHQIHPDPESSSAIPVLPHHLAYVIYTSGSTGQPKGVMIDHRALSTMLTDFRTLIPTGRDLRLLSVAPFTFDVSVLEIFCTLTCGGTLFLQPQGSMLEMHTFLEFLAKKEITGMYLPPTVLGIFARVLHNFSPSLCLKWLLVGVEPIQQSLLEKIKNLLPDITIINAYGPTEATVISTCHLFKHAAHPERRTPIGRGLPSYTVILVNEKFHQSGTGEVGQILIAGNALSRGYLGDARKTAGKFRTLSIKNQPDQIYFLTGDYGRYLENGEIEFEGRRDNQVKIRGYRVETSEPEIALRKHHLVDNAIIIPYRDEMNQSTLLCFYTSNDQKPIEGLRDYLGTQLPEYMIPSAIVFKEQFPCTRHGKIDRQTLLQTFPEEKTSVATPQSVSPTELLIKKLYCDVLKTEIKDTRLSLTDLGGDSVSVMILLVRIEEEMGIRIPVGEFYRNSTIEKLCAYIIGHPKADQAPLLSLTSFIPQAIGPVSTAQKELWLVEQLDNSRITHNVVVKITCSGAPDVEKLTNALFGTFARYDVFNVAIKEQGNELILVPEKDVRPEFRLTDLTQQSVSFRSEVLETFETGAGRTPFLLSKPPLFRLDIFILDQKVTLIYLTIHHIIFDGWSLGLVIRDVLQEVVSDTDEQLKIDTSVDYRTYAQWSQKMLKEGFWDPQLVFWEKQLSDLPPPLQIRHSAKDDVKPDDGNRYYWEISESLFSRIRTFAQTHGVTRFSMLLSAFGLMLYQLSRRSDILIGTAWANRLDAELQRVPGYFTNMLALRVRPQPHLSVRDFVRQTGMGVVNSFANAQYPFGELVKKLRIDRQGTQPSFFEAMFIMQNWSQGTFSSEGVTFNQEEIGNHTAKTDILFNASELDNGCKCWFEYPNALFTTQEMEKLSGCILELLERMTDHQETTLGEICDTGLLFPVVYLIGSGSLINGCLDRLMEKDWIIASVVTNDPATKLYCDHRKVTVLPVQQGLNLIRSEYRQCWLFSINNEFIIPDSLLSKTNITAINYHDSLLPRYAGLNASNWAILSGEKEHGISWHLMTKEIDAGDIAYRQIVPLVSENSVESLNLQCFEAALEGFSKLLSGIEHGTISYIPQYLQLRSYHGLADRPAGACLVDFSDNAENLARLSRATSYRNTNNEFGVPRLKTGDRWYIVPEMTTVYGMKKMTPGTVISIDPQHLIIAAGKDAVEISGILDQFGHPLVLQDWYLLHGIREGFRFPIPDHPVPDKIKLTNRKIIVNEKFWKATLQDHKPVSLPFFLSQDDKSGGYIYDTYLITFDQFQGIQKIAATKNAGMADLIIAAIIVFISRLTGLRNFEIPFGYNQSNTLPVSFFLPLSVSIDPGSDFLNAIDEIQKARTLFHAKGPFYADLFLRYPVLTKKKPAESFFGNQVYIAIDPQESDLFEPTDIHLGFILHTQHNTLEFRCFMPEAMHQPAKKTAERLKQFIHNIGLGDKMVGNISFLSPEDKTFLIDTLNKNIGIPSHNEDIISMFRNAVRNHSRETAIIAEGQMINYLQLGSAAETIAQMLHVRGLRSGDTVALFLERSPMLIVSIIGVLHAGGAFLPLDPGAPRSRLEQIFDLAKPRWVISSAPLIEQLPVTINSPILPDEGILTDNDAVVSEDTVHFNPDATAYIIFTSGTTGTPKGVNIARKSLSSFCKSSMDHYNLSATDRVLQFSSIAFDTALEEIFPTLCSGASLVLRSREMAGSVTHFLEMTSKWKITVLNLPTAYWHQFTRQLTGEKLSIPACVRMVIIGGEKANAGIVRWWRDRIGKRPVLINTYGPTETTVVATKHTFDPSDDRNELPIGRPIRNVQVLVVDDNLHPVLPHIVGELLIGGIQVAQGYSGDEQSEGGQFIYLSSTPFDQIRFYRSGDLVYYDEKGVLFYTGRKDNQLKIRGYRVNPVEIDQVISTFPGITGSVTLAHGEHEKLKLICYYTMAGGVHSIEEQLPGFLAGKLPDYMIPALMIPVEKFPLTPNQKIDLAALPAPEDWLHHHQRALPVSETEIKVAGLYSSILNIPEVGVKSNFFSLGGDSLDAVMILSKIDHEFGINIPLRRFYELNTIQAIAGELERLRVPDTISPVSVGPKPSESTKHISFLQPRGTKPPLFVIYGDKANLYLPEILGHDQPVFTFLPQGSDGEKIRFRTVESMACLYLNEMVEIYPEGPYHIAGFSFGGLIALEMACQMQAMGARPGKITLIDTAAPHLFRSIIHHVSWRIHLERSAQHLFRSFCIMTGIRIPPSQRNLYILHSFADAAKSYYPSTPEHPVHFSLIRSMHSVADEPDLGWSKVEHYFPEVHHIEGDHRSIVREYSCVKQYAAILTGSNRDFRAGVV